MYRYPPLDLSWSRSIVIQFDRLQYSVVGLHVLIRTFQHEYEATRRVSDAKAELLSLIQCVPYSLSFHISVGYFGVESNIYCSPCNDNQHGV